MTNSTQDQPDEKKSNVTIICDSEGTLLAASCEPHGWLNPTGVPPGGVSPDIRHYAGVFGADSELTRWIAGQMELARISDLYSASSDISHDGEVVRVTFERLTNSGRPFGYIIHLATELSERASLTDQERWHDIKNQLGGIKLYAVFLHKKLPDSDDKQVVEKLLKAIDSLTDRLTRIRRGEVT